MKKALLFLCSLVVFAGSAFAQVPTYQFSASGPLPVSKDEPFNASATGTRTQYIYPQAGGGYFNGAPSGYITKIYFYVPAGSSATNATYSNFTVKLGSTAVTNATATFISPLSTVIPTTASYVIPTVATNAWIGFDLPTPYIYDNTKGLVVEVSHTGFSNGFKVWGIQNAPNNKRIYANSATATSGSIDIHQAWFGFDVKIPCDTIAGITASNITYNSMDITWPGLGRDSSFEWIVTDTANPPVDVPAGNFQPYLPAVSPTNKIELKNLPSDSCFYLQIARICKVENSYDTFSYKWTTVKLCTLPACETPKVNITKVTHSTAIATWDPVPTVEGYEYAVSISPDPPVKGQKTIATSLYLQGLSPNTAWYFHLRAMCKPTPLSSWGSTWLHTMVTSVEDVNGGDFTVEAYPNPVQNELNVRMLGTIGNNANIIISDVTGKIVRNIAVVNNETKVDMSGLTGGLYILKYSDATRSQVIKVNKQ